MKRIRLAGAAVAGLLITGAPAAAAATPHASAKAAAGKSTTSKTATTKIRCKLSLTLQAPADSTDVVLGATDGTQLGSARCGAPFGAGLASLSFTEAADGSLSGAWQDYFNAGTIYGEYALTPADSGPPSTTSFASASYSGTVTVKAGAGAAAKTTGTGTLTCSTTDGVHYSCSEVAKLVLPPTLKNG